MRNELQNKIQKYTIVFMKPFLVLFIIGMLAIVLNGAYVLFVGIPATSWLAVYPPPIQQLFLWVIIVTGLIAIGFTTRQIKNINLKDIIEAIEKGQNKK